MKDIYELSDLEVSTPVDTSENNILIVDALNLCFRWRVLFDSIDPETESVGYAEKFAETVKSLQKSYKAKKAIIACDRGKSTFRKKIYPEYKASRERDREFASDTDKARMKAFLDEYIATVEYCRAIPNFHVVVEKGVEADDIAAMFTNEYYEEFDNIWMISGDKDWDLLVRPNVHKFNFATKANWKNADKTGPRPKEVTVDNWFEHHLCTEEQYLGLRMLEGDKSDNIPGVKGIGEKRALKFMHDYGSIDNLISSLPLNGKAQYIQALNEAKDDLKVYKKLMDLNNYEEHITEEEKASIREQISSIYQ